MTNEETLAWIKEEAERVGSITELARQWGVNASHLAAVIGGRRPLSARLAALARREIGL